MTGDELRRSREARGWTQAELAARVGRSQSTISALEMGRIQPPAFLRHRLEEALSGPGPDIRGERREAPLPFRLPRLDLEARSLELPVAAVRWQRPAAGGDFFLLHPLPGGSLFAAAVDVAGHGQRMLPASSYLQGWLRGWLSSLSAAPRLQVLVTELSRELREVDLDCGGFFALLTPARAGSHAVSLEAMSCGFPAPLILAGPPFRTLEAPAVGRPLPASPAELGPPENLVLHAPWRLVMASDGLLDRLGGGDQPLGLFRLREWHTGPRRDEALEPLLASPSPETDDELYAHLEWRGWDLEAAFFTTDDADRHRTLEMIRQRVHTALGKGPADAFEQALVEAVSNAHQHGYDGRGGLVRVRFRDEVDSLRVEIQDSGRNRVGKREVSRPASGFAVMRAGTSTVDVKNGPEGGTVVTLVAEKPASRAEERRKS
ncbi:MAG TPA: helix-turn-helix domain-containing protein [Thermoanaerobaculia bacterium]|nr:helix-turn-helix domain-containing protein [Thermoanaerobaculia bacterium]